MDESTVDLGGGMIVPLSEVLEDEGPCQRCGGVGCEACDARWLALPDGATERVAGRLSTEPPYERMHPESLVLLARDLLNAALQPFEIPER